MGEGALNLPSISKFIPLGLSSGFHHVVFGFSHHPLMLGNSKKSIGLVTSCTELKTASAAMAYFSPRWLLPQLCPFTPQYCQPGPWGETGGGGTGLSLGLQPAGGSGLTVAYRGCRQRRAFSSLLLTQETASSSLPLGR